jgi:transmembrane sensor
MENKNKYQSINQSIDQSVRYYRVPRSVEKGAALNSLLEKIHQTPKAQPRVIPMFGQLRWAAGLAAAAVIILAVIFFTGQESITNNSRQASAFRLPDNSRVVLAPGSSTSFSKQFRQREVSLEGEGYFEVIHGRSFRVKTSAGNVQVLGTRFSVKETVKALEVSCFEGSVKVANRERDRILQPGESIRLAGTHAELTSTGGTKFPALAVFRAAYDNTEMAVILKDMESFFGISIRSDVKQDRFYTGSFETGSLENALVLLCEPLGLEYRINENNTVIIY